MNKKIISITLIIIMVICNSMTVWAAESAKTDTVTSLTDGNNVKQQDVTASFNMSGAGDVFNVTIEWGSLAYSPSATVNGQWNTAGYYTVSNGPVTWQEATAGSSIVKVTNGSNVGVTATFSYDMDSNFLNDYFLTDNKKNAAKFTFGATSGYDGVFSTGTVDGKTTGIVTLGTLAKNDTNTVGSVNVGVTAEIEKADSLENTNKKLGTVTVTIAKKE